MELPIIAIVGRPNVGKSTLFNRLIGKRYAVTSPIAGTTRDRIYHDAEVGGYDVILVDTGGLEFDKKKDIEADVQAQAKIAIEEAHLIFFAIDATAPLTASDLEAARFLRKSRKPIILIAHKTDNKKSEEMMPQLFELGLGSAVPLSSIHNLGFDELDAVTKKTIKKIPAFAKKTKAGKMKKSDTLSVAIVGKPNVGKSSMVNTLLGTPRLIVSHMPGTTIDATDTPFTFNNKKFVLIDTAGLRRRGKVGKGIERLGVLRSLQAIARADVTCLMLDYGEGLTNQDLHVSQYILDAGKGLIVVVNKSDLMEDPEEEQKKFLFKLHYRMEYMPWAPVIFTSTVTKKNIRKIFELAEAIGGQRQKKIPDREFKIFAKTTVLAHPPTRSGQRVIISDGVQTGVAPPTFTFTCNKPDLVHFSYRRFLENEIRRKYGFAGTALRLEFKNYHAMRGSRS